MDARIKAAGAANAYFPLFIPQSYLQPRGRARRGLRARAGGRHPRRRQGARGAGRRAPDQRDDHQHLLLQVGAELPRPAAADQPVGQRRAVGAAAPRCSCARPSSSGRRATPAHATERGRRAYAARILHDVYADFMVNVLAMPVLPGRKTARERFPGAINTLDLEAMMGDGKACRWAPATSSARTSPRRSTPSTPPSRGHSSTCGRRRGASSTRMVGGLIMCHGDDAGLRRAAPRWPRSRSSCCSSATRTAPAERRRRLAAELRGAGVRVRARRRAADRFGRRVDRLGAEGRAGARRGRPPRPGRGRGDLGAARHGREGARCRSAEVAARGAAAARATSRATLLAEATERSGRPHGRRRHRRGGDRGGRRRASPGCPGPRRRRAAKTACGADGVTVALPAPPTDGSLPARRRRAGPRRAYVAPGLLTAAAGRPGYTFSVRCKCHEGVGAAHAFCFVGALFDTRLCCTRRR